MTTEKDARKIMSVASYIACQNILGKMVTKILRIEPDGNTEGDRGAQCRAIQQYQTCVNKSLEDMCFEYSEARGWGFTRAYFKVVISDFWRVFYG